MGKRVLGKEDELVKYFKENVLKLEDTDYDLFCDNARKYAKRLKNAEVNTSMIRKIYSRILNAADVSSIKRLRPQFAYTSGRNGKNVVLKEFMDILDYIAKTMKSDNENHLKYFKQFMEAIVAYRKYVGGDNN